MRLDLSQGRIETTFAVLRAKGRAALMPYVTVGYPDLATTLELVPALVEAGADLVELGVPFSDPLADGATIQRSSHSALLQGATIDRCLEMAAELSSRTSAPLLLMGYYNPFLCYGPDRLCYDASAAGIDGLIVPDLPPEEAAELLTPARLKGLDLIFLVAPTSSDERIARISSQGSGFLYCVSVAGVTGVRQNLSSALPELVGRIRRQSKLPIAVGFGVAGPEQAATVARLADGVIVGSALIDRLESLPPAECVRGAASFIGELREAMDRSTGFSTCESP